MKKKIMIRYFLLSEKKKETNVIFRCRFFSVEWSV
jgi:hypothetical protein